MVKGRPVFVGDLTLMYNFVLLCGNVPKHRKLDTSASQRLRPGDSRFSASDDPVAKRAGSSNNTSYQLRVRDDGGNTCESLQTKCLSWEVADGKSFDCLQQPLPDRIKVLLCLVDGAERRQRLQAKLNSLATQPEAAE